MSNPDMRDQLDGSEIAIIGMAGRFPGAPDLATYWRNLRDGVESITPVSDAELAASGVPTELPFGRPERLGPGTPVLTASN